MRVVFGAVGLGCALVDGDRKARNSKGEKGG